MRLLSGDCIIYKLEIEYGHLIFVFAGGVVMFTRSLAFLKRRGIRVNVLCPEVNVTTVLVNKDVLVVYQCFFCCLNCAYLIALLLSCCNSSCEFLFKVSLKKIFPLCIMASKPLPVGIGQYSHEYVDLFLSLPSFLLIYLKYANYLSIKYK